MAIINNPWLNTLQRSYNDIKVNLLNKVNLMVQDSVNPLLTSEEDKNKRAITDTTEGNIFTLLISMFSGIAEVIHYYIDSMARETFFITARRYTSLQKHCKMLDYHIKSANPPSVNLLIQRTKEDREDLIIPVYKPNLSNNVVFKDSSGNQWVTETEYRLRGSYEKISAKARAMVRNLSVDKTTKAWGDTIAFWLVPGATVVLSNYTTGGYQQSSTYTLSFDYLIPDEVEPGLGGLMTAFIIAIRLHNYTPDDAAAPTNFSLKMVNLTDSSGHWEGSFTGGIPDDVASQVEQKDISLSMSMVRGTCQFNNVVLKKDGEIVSLPDQQYSTLPPQSQTPVCTVNINNSEGGSIVVTRGNSETITTSGELTEGEIVSIKATPESGYKFVEWWDGNANNPRELKITSDLINTELNITATFVEDESGSGGEDNPGPELPDLVGQDLPFIVISVVQKEYVAKQSFGTINQQNTVLYVPNIPSNKYYVEGSMTLWVNDEIWSLVDTFAYSGPGDKVYKIELDQNMRPYVVFPSDVLNGTVPDIGSEVFGEFYMTNGANANIAAGSITNVPSQIPNSSNYKVLQQSAASGGTNYETFGMIKQRLPLMMKSMNIGITKEDFEAIAMNINGVAKAYVDYKCGQRFTLYISPENGILPSQSLLDSVREVINQRKALSTNYTIDFIRPEYIFVNMVVTGKKSASEEIITKQIIETLTNFYSFENADPNRLVALSDIYGMVENLKTVDFLYINSLVFIPQVKAANYTSSPQIRISNFATDYTPKPYKDLGSTLVDQSSYDVYLTLTADFENQSFEIGLDNSIYNSTGITIQTNGDLKFDQQFSIDISFNSNATMKVINQIDGGYQLSYAPGKIIEDHFKCSMILTCDQLNTVGHQEINTDDPEAHHYSLVLRIPFIGSSYSPSGELGNNKYSEVKTILGQGAFEGHSLQLMDQNNITIKVNEVI